MLDDIFGNILKGVDAQAAGHLRAEVGIVDIVGVRLTHSEDLADDRNVRDAQRGSKVIQQQGGAAEGVGLEDRPYLLVAHLHRGGQRGGQLCRMVGKVVGDSDAVRRAENLKASVYAGELVEVFGDLRGLCAEIVRACRGR